MSFEGKTEPPSVCYTATAANHWFTEGVADVSYALPEAVSQFIGFFRKHVANQVHKLSPYGAHLSTALSRKF